MIRRRGHVNVPDLVSVTVPVFTPDERGGALFHGITNGNLGRLNTAVRIDARGGGDWHGWTTSPQKPFTGHRLGAGRPVVDPVSTIDQERGIGTNPVQAIFADRMAARRFG